MYEFLICDIFSIFCHAGRICLAGTKIEAQRKGYVQLYMLVNLADGSTSTFFLNSFLISDEMIGLHSALTIVTIVTTGLHKLFHPGWENMD